MSLESSSLWQHLTFRLSSEYGSLSTLRVTKIGNIFKFSLQATTPDSFILNFKICISKIENQRSSFPGGNSNAHNQNSEMCPTSHLANQEMEFIR